MVDVFFHMAFVAGFFMSCSMPHMPGRRAMLAANVVGSFLFCLYFYGYDAHAAILASAIAGFSSFLQLLFPEEKMDQTAMLRFFIAALMSLIAILVCYESPTDILPLCAITMVRFAEARKSQQSIRYGNVFAVILWIIYGMDQGLYLAVCADIIIFISYAVGIWREEKARRLQKVAIRVSKGN